MSSHRDGEDEFDDGEDERGRSRYPESAGFEAGSDTSQGAAEDQDDSGKRESDILLVKAALIEAGPLGLICDEWEAMSGMLHQTASARFRDAVLRGIAVDTDMRRLTRSGHPATVRVYAPFLQTEAAA